MTQVQEKRYRIAEAPPGFKRKKAKETSLHYWTIDKIAQYKSQIASDTTINSNQVDALITKFTVAINYLRVGSSTTRRLKALAFQLHKSYALIRKWRTEPSFLNLISRLSSEFIDGVLEEYLYTTKLMFTAIDESDENPAAQKHLASTAHIIPQMLIMANDDWGFILYKEAYNRLPKMIREQKDLRVQGPLYALLLLCCIRSNGKLNLSKSEARQYKGIFQDFMATLGWKARKEAEKGHSFQILYYLDIFFGLSWVFHEKLVERFLPNDFTTLFPSVLRHIDKRDLKQIEDEMKL